MGLSMRSVQVDGSPASEEGTDDWMAHWFESGKIKRLDNTEVWGKTLSDLVLRSDLAAAAAAESFH